MANTNKIDLLIDLYELKNIDQKYIPLVFELRNNFYLLSNYAYNNSNGEFSVNEIDLFIFKNISHCGISKHFDLEILLLTINDSKSLIDKYSITFDTINVNETSKERLFLEEYIYSNLVSTAELHYDSIRHGITSNKIIASYRKILASLYDITLDSDEDLIKQNDIIIQESMLIFEKGNYLAYASTFKQCMEFTRQTDKSILYIGSSYIVFSNLLELAKNTDLAVYTTDKFMNPIFYSKLMRNENYCGVIRRSRNKVKVPSTYEGAIITDRLSDTNSISCQNTLFKVFSLSNYINDYNWNDTMKKSLLSIVSEAIDYSQSTNSILKSDYKYIYSGFGHRYIADKKEVLLNRIISKEINDVIILVGDLIDNKTIDDLLLDSTSRFIITCGLDQKVVSKYKDSSYVVSTADIDDLYTICKSIEFVNSSLINALKIKPKIYLSVSSFDEIKYTSIFRYFEFENVTLLSKDIKDGFKELVLKLYNINIINFDEDSLAIA